MSVHSVLGAKASTRPLLRRVQSYRGGYSKADRREIEQRLFTGELLGVIATNALELGIDIGELDCTMHLGLPTSVSSLWQQAGRAGRKHTQSSMAVLVCFDAPLDQHFARHPNELFTLQPEAVTLNANNSKVLGPHLLNAAHEYALYDSRSGLSYIDTSIYGTAADNEPLLVALVQQQLLLQRTNVDSGGYRTHSCALKTARAVNLRGISDVVCTVVTDDATPLVLDSIPGETMYFQVYPTAVYLHQAQEYIITRLDVDKKVAYARRCAQKLTYYTACRDITEIEVVKIQRRTKLVMGASMLIVCEGQVVVTTSVYGSTLIEKRSMRVLHVNEFSLPPIQSFGQAMWFELPHECRHQVEASSFAWSGALHGVGHLLLAVIPLFILCDNSDLNTEHYNPCGQQVRPNRITIYERRDGGTGVVDEIIRELPAIVEKAWTIAHECVCVTGCPSCIHSTQCTEYNKVLDKRGSMMVLTYLRSRINQCWRKKQLE